MKNNNAVWVVAPEQLKIQHQEIADPAWNEIQIQAKACGICALDSALYQGISATGPMPYVLGHEVAGVVCKVGGGVRDFKVGDKVYTANGGQNNQMSQYVNNLAAGVGRLPDEVENYAEWVLEPTCCVVNLIHQAGIRPGNHVVLVGTGYMGLLTLMGLSHTLAGLITVFETREENRRLAQRYQPDYCFDPYSEAGQSHIQELCTQGGADIVIDFGSCDASYTLASSLVKQKAGKLVLGSWYRHRMPFDGTQWHLGGLTVLNASPMMNPYYNEMIVRQTAALVKKGVFRPAELISHVIRYDDPELGTLFAHSITKEDHYIKGIVLF